MRGLTIVIYLFLFGLVGCNSVATYQAHLQKELTPEQQKKDIRFAQKKINKLHPSIDWYLPKGAFDHSMDSLVKATKNFKKPNDFFFQLSPLVAQVRQGHMRLGFLPEKVTKQEAKRRKKLGMGPMSQVPIILHDEKFYLSRNLSGDSTIKVGSRFLKINGISLDSLYQKHRKTYTSDGFNQTYFPYRFQRSFSNIYALEFGFLDSLQCTFSWKDGEYTKMVHRKKSLENKEKTSSKTTKDTTKVISNKQITFSKKENIRKKKRIFGYDVASSKFQRELQWIGKDSTVAYLKIRGFSKGRYRKAYQQIFDEITQKQGKYLVIDLRDNPGGLLNEITELYSYLSDKPFQMIDTPTVVSKTSMLSPYWNTAPWYAYPVAVPMYPFFAVFQTIKTKKTAQGTYQYALESSKIKTPKPNNFKGEVFVLINGGSFSASCLFSSMLQTEGRGILIGEETGGTAHGTVAGFMPVYRLPNSKLPLRLGIMDIRPVKVKGVEGRGVLPDIELLPSLEDKLQRKDPELGWILNKLQK
ncbi:MAG: S41 family peptidase [Flavobacterium sp.]